MATRGCGKAYCCDLWRSTFDEKWQRCEAWLPTPSITGQHDGLRLRDPCFCRRAWSELYQSSWLCSRLERLDNGILPGRIWKGKSCAHCQIPLAQRFRRNCALARSVICCWHYGMVQACEQKYFFSLDQLHYTFHRHSKLGWWKIWGNCQNFPLWYEQSNRCARYGARSYHLPSPSDRSLWRWKRETRLAARDQLWWCLVAANDTYPWGDETTHSVSTSDRWQWLVHFRPSCLLVDYALAEVRPFLYLKSAVGHPIKTWCRVFTWRIAKRTNDGRWELKTSYRWDWGNHGAIWARI